MSSTFWDGTQSFHGAVQAAIPHMKEDIQDFHMSPQTGLIVSDFFEQITSLHLNSIVPRNRIEWKE